MTMITTTSPMTVSPMSVASAVAPANAEQRGYVTRDQQRSMKLLALGALLGNPEGAAMPVVEIGRKVGMSPGTVRRYRRLMKETGMLGAAGSPHQVQPITYPEPTFDALKRRLITLAAAAYRLERERGQGNPMVRALVSEVEEMSELLLRKRRGLARFGADRFEAWLKNAEHFLTLIA